MNSTPGKTEPGEQRNMPHVPAERTAARSVLAPVPILQGVWELNARCVSLLAEAARAPASDDFALLRYVRDALLKASPETQARAARKPFLLLDMQFSNIGWWQAVVNCPARAPLLPSERGHFPSSRGRALARATLSVAWHGLRADKYAHCRLGMLPAVGAVVQALSLTELERLAERRFRFLRPRWEDRPAVWLQLLESAATADFRPAREFNIRALQLLVGGLLSP